MRRCNVFVPLSLALLLGWATCALGDAGDEDQTAGTDSLGTGLIRLADVGPQHPQ